MGGSLDGFDAVHFINDIPGVVKTYSAPWGLSLIVLSIFASLICLAAATVAALHDVFWISALLFAILVVSLLFTIRGYTVIPGALLVHRLFWPTRLSLAGLESAEVAPEAMRWSVRTFGNGGLFSFSGWYYKRALGSYRVFVTDPSRSVLLRIGGRRVVVSPGEPENFVRDLQANARPA